MRQLILLVRLYLGAVLITACIAGCTSGLGPQETGPSAIDLPAVTAQLPPPSGLRRASYEPGDLVLSGSAFGVLEYNITVSGDFADFAPNPAGVGLERWSWGLYAFTITDYDGMVSVTMDWTGGEPPADLWLGVSDWTLDSWYFVEAPGGTAQFGDYTESGHELISPDDSSLYALVLYGGADPVTLEQIRIGYTGWGGWTHTWGGGDVEFIRDIAVDAEGSIYFAGRTDSFDVGQGDVLVGKVSAAGALEWARVCGGFGREEANAICLGDGVLYVGGVYYSASGGDDALIQRWDLSGNLLDSKAFGTADDELAAALALTVSGIYFGGYTYNQEAPERTDCDALVARLEPDLSALEYYRAWGTEQYDQIVSLAIPPAASDAVACVQNVGPDQWMWENLAPRLSMVYDVGGADHYALSLPGCPTVGARGSVAGAGWDHYLTGWFVPPEPDAEPAVWLLRYNWGAATPGEMAGPAWTWTAPGADYAEGWCVDYCDGRLLVGGSSGLDDWPGGSMYPTVFTASDGGFDRWAGRWGDGISGWTVHSLRCMQGSRLAVGGDVEALSGDWNWYRAGLIGLRIAENNVAAPTDRVLGSYSYFDTAPTVTDITSDFEGGEDVGAGFADAFVSALFSLGQEPE